MAVLIATAAASMTPGLQETHRTSGPQRPENMVVGSWTRRCYLLVGMLWMLKVYMVAKVRKYHYHATPRDPLAASSALQLVVTGSNI